MATIKFYRAKALPSPITSAHDGVWYIKKAGESFFRTYVVKGGVLSREYLDDLEIGGRNYLPTNRNLYSIDLYQNYQFQTSENDYILTVTDRDTEVDMSGLYICTTSHWNPNVSPWVKWIVQNGVIENTKISGNRELFFSVFPNTKEVLEKVFRRFYIKLERGTIATDWSPAPEDFVFDTDVRLSNSREWVAETVSQAEAESGTATTRRAWTAQRVRQAINKRLESLPSGVQNLQAVTDVGSETTNIIKIRRSDDLRTTLLSSDGGIFNNYIGPVVNIPGGKEGEPAHSSSLKAAGLRFDADAPHSVAYNRLGIFYRKDLGFLFPSDRTQASTTMMRSVNGVVPDAVTGDVVIETNPIRPLNIVTVNGCYASGWPNESRLIYRTSEVCILASPTDEGKEIIVINDLGLSINVSVSSTPFNKLKSSGFPGRTQYASFPIGFKGRFRVIDGEFFEVG